MGVAPGQDADTWANDDTEVRQAVGHWRARSCQMSLVLCDVNKMFEGL